MFLFHPRVTWGADTRNFNLPKSMVSTFGIFLPEQPQQCCFRLVYIGLSRHRRKLLSHNLHRQNPSTDNIPSVSVSLLSQSSPWLRTYKTHQELMQGAPLRLHLMNKFCLAGNTAYRHLTSFHHTPPLNTGFISPIFTSWYPPHFVGNVGLIPLGS